MATLAEIKEWFRTGLKPTQIQFWATWDSFWHKDTPIPQSAVENLQNTLINKADIASLEEHINDPNAHGGGGSDLQSTLDAGSEAVLEEGTYNVKIGEDIGFGNFNGTEYLQDRNEFKGTSAYKVNTDNGTFRQEGYVDIYSESSYTHAYLTSKFYKPDSGMYLCSELDLFSTNTGEAAGFSLTLRDETSDWSGLHYQTTDALGRSGIIVKDNYHSKGLEYFLDYSANYTDRSLVDKAYVDSVAGGSSNITPNFNQVLGAGSSGFLVDDGTGSSEEITMTVASSDYADFSNMKIGVSGSYMSSAQNFSAKAKLLGVFNEAILAVVDGAERIRVNDNGTTFSYVPITYSNESVLRASMTTPAHVPSIGKVQEMIAGNTPNLQSILNLSSGANIATTDAENKNFFVNYTNTDTGYFYRLWAGRDQAFIVGRSGSTGFYAGETTATMACNDCPAYIIGQTGVNIQSNDGNVSLQGNAVLANGNNVITSVTNGINTVYADSDGVVDISSISGGGSNDDIPTLQQVVEAGAEGIAPYIDGEVGLRLGQSNSEGELQGIVCYPSNVNLQSTYVNLLATEALYAEARTGYTLTTFGGDITFNVPAGKFIVNENSVLTGNYGTITINPSTGNTFTIPHNFYNLYGNPVPSYVSVRFSKYSPDLMYYTTTVDETNITITFPTVPTETSLDIYWEVRP